jgi:opacity protein-like surface antigen
MRKPLVIATLALALFALAPAASSQAAPQHDQVTGTGTAGQFGAPQLHVNAVQTQDGVKGGFTIEYPDGTTVTGRVTCLVVAGAVGYVTGVITESSGPRQVPNNWLPGNYVAIGVEDTGEPGTAGPDLLNFSPGFNSDPGCGPNDQAIPTVPILAGNYQVFDAM